MIYEPFHDQFDSNNPKDSVLDDKRDDGDFVLYSDHVAREKELLAALRAYRDEHAKGTRDCTIQEYKYETDDGRCDLCKRADRLLKEGE